MRSNYVNPALFEKIMRRMRPQNALALRVSLETGLRIDDVLELKKNVVEQFRTFPVVEKKTGKSRVIYLSDEIRAMLLAWSGRYYIFSSSKSELKHRTRQTVHYDMKKAVKGMGIDAAHISPHTARKIFAVRLYHLTGNLEHVQRVLNHKNASTTMYYAFADKLCEKVKCEPRPIKMGLKPNPWNKPARAGAGDNN